MRGLGGGKNGDAGPRMRRRGIGEQDYLIGRKTELGAGEQIGHGLCVINRAVEVLKGLQLATAVGAAGGMFCRSAWRLICIDADQQRPLGLRRSQRPNGHSCQCAKQGTAQANAKLHHHSRYSRKNITPLRLPRLSPRSEQRHAFVCPARATWLVVPASRGPEKFSSSQELKPRLSREVARKAWRKNVCAYGPLCRRSPMRRGFNQTLDAAGRKSATPVAK